MVEVTKIGKDGKPIGGPRAIPEEQLAQYKSRGYKMADGSDIKLPEPKKEAAPKKPAKKKTKTDPAEEPKE